MRLRTTLAAGTAAAALIIGLTACAGTEAAPESTPAPEPTASASASPEPSESVPTIDAQDPSTWPATADGMGPMTLGAAFDESVAALPEGAEVLPGCEWLGSWSSPDAGYQVYVQRDEAGDGASPTVLVTASASAEATSSVGPRTAEGIGIGSTVEEAQTAYPAAEVLESVGDRRSLRVPAEGEAGIFLTYTEGAPTIWSVTVTTLDEPPYEACA